MIDELESVIFDALSADEIANAKFNMADKPEYSCQGWQFQGTNIPKLLTVDNRFVALLGRHDLRYERIGPDVYVRPIGRG